MKTEHKVSESLVDKMIEIGFPFSWSPYEVTVMEMFDVIYPKRSIAEIISRWEKQMWPNRMGEHTNISLPDFLAKEIIWLYENNHISFSK